MSVGLDIGASSSAPLTRAELLSKFESLGDDCELGAVQRHFGAEPLGLFRWSNPLPKVILHGLDNDFADLGRRARVGLDAQTPAEWILEEPDYGLRQHTHVREGDLPGEVVQKQQMQRFAFLKWKLLGDIEEGAKIFVMKSCPNLAYETVAPVAAALRRKGPTWLLWVVGGEAAGHVEVVETGLMKGTVAYLQRQGENFGNFSYDTWLQMLEAAWALMSEPTADRAGCRRKIFDNNR